MIGLPAVLAIKWLGLPMVDRLQLRRPALKDLGLGLVAGGLAPCLGDLIFQWQDGLIPVSTEALTQLEQALPMDLPLWALLGLIALLPAVCEEFLFRGAILGLLRKGLGPADIGIGLQVLGAALAIAAVAGMGRSRG